MFIKKINHIDYDSGEADIIVSDGEYELLCYCALIQESILKNICDINEIESFLCANIRRIDTSSYLVQKNNGYYSYHLQGAVISSSERIVCIGDIFIKLDIPLPKDICNHEFIEFDVVRLDCSIKSRSDN